MLRSVSLVLAHSLSYIDIIGFIMRDRTLVIKKKVTRHHDASNFDLARQKPKVARH